MNSRCCFAEPKSSLLLGSLDLHRLGLNNVPYGSHFASSSPMYTINFSGRRPSRDPSELQLDDEFPPGVSSSHNRKSLYESAMQRAAWDGQRLCPSCWMSCARGVYEFLAPSTASLGDLIPASLRPIPWPFIFPIPLDTPFLTWKSCSLVYKALGSGVDAASSCFLSMQCLIRPFMLLICRFCQYVGHVLG